jgi:hypothetical protein
MYTTSMLATSSQGEGRSAGILEIEVLTQMRKQDYGLVETFYDRTNPKCYLVRGRQQAINRPPLAVSLMALTAYLTAYLTASQLKTTYGEKKIEPIQLSFLTSSVSCEEIDALKIDALNSSPRRELMSVCPDSLLHPSTPLQLSTVSAIRSSSRPNHPNTRKRITHDAPPANRKDILVGQGSHEDNVPHTHLDLIGGG